MWIPAEGITTVSERLESECESLPRGPTWSSFRSADAETHLDLMDLDSAQICSAGTSESAD